MLRFHVTELIALESNASDLAVSEELKKVSLEQEASYILEEARMVVPGLQALFGFQLIAVFNERFSAELSRGEQGLHLGAVVLVAISLMLIMAPAAYHRQAERGVISRYFLDRASSVLTWAMAALMFAISMDIYLVARLILKGTLMSSVIALVLLVALAWLWFVFPRHKAKRRPHS